MSTSPEAVLWVVLQGQDLDLARLSAERIPIIPTPVGNAISGPSLPQVAAMFSINLDEWEAVPSPIAGVDVRRKKSDHKVSFGYFGNYESNIKGRALLEQAVHDILIPAIGKDVVIHCPHSGRTIKSARLIDASKFHISIWDSPSRDMSIPMPPIIDGVGVNSGLGNSFAPTGDGLCIGDESNDYCVAELIGNILYIHHDLCHEGTVDEATLFRKILSGVAEHVSSGASPAKELTPEEIEKRDEAKKKKVKDKYVVLCRKRIRSSIDTHKRNIGKYTTDIKNAEAAILKATMAKGDSRIKLHAMENNDAKTNEAYQLEFDNLLSMPGVEKVDIFRNNIQVYTDEIHITHKGKVYRIGKFRIDIDIRGEGGGVHCINLTNAKNCGSSGSTYQHPHVSGTSGNCCLGNLKGAIPKMVGEYRFAIVAQIMIRYLGDVNEGDWHVNINNWDVITTIPEAKKTKRRKK